ncbi:MAG TPA: nuclear transport factor 2 family protein [Mucilaginibacter sp.]|nr:nuclear transport factor 2 family protein [Mucilaginibacter sp.]
MKSSLTILLTIGIITASFAQNKDTQILKKLNHDWISSYVTKDTATMSRIFADDLVLVSPNGKTFHKKDILTNVISPAQEYTSAKVDTVSVRLIGNVGLVSAKASVVAKTNGKPSTIRTSYLDVYEKRKGRWYAVASQVALLSAN